MKKALGIDIGGTKIYAAYVNEAGEIVSDIEKHSTPKSSEEIIEKLKEIIAQHENEIEFSAISTAGGVNKENTKVICSTANLPFGYPKTDFSALSNKPVFVEYFDEKKSSKIVVFYPDGSEKVIRNSVDTEAQKNLNYMVCEFRKISKDQASSEFIKLALDSLKSNDALTKLSNLIDGMKLARGINDK